MSLKTEDVKAGDAVECIDIAEFSKIWRESQGYDINKMENTSILEIGPYYFRLKGKFLIGNMGFDEIRASLDCLKYFKKKDQSQQYTFDDLIDVAVQAKKDGVIKEVTLGSNYIMFIHNGIENRYFDQSDNRQAINNIKSFYKETFVIECEEDLKRVNPNPKITLNNGEVIPFSFKSAVKDHLIFYDQPCGHNVIHFVFLKGATVEQERGRDD